MGRKARAGQGNFFTGWFSGQRPMRFLDFIRPTALYNDSSHFIANDSDADVRALIMRQFLTAGIGLHRGIRITPSSSPILITWIGVGGSGADTVQFRVASIEDRPSEAAQTALVSTFSQGALTASSFQTSVATANLPPASERLWEATTQSGPTTLDTGFKWGMVIVPVGSEFSMWSTTSGEATQDMGVSWREFPNL